LGRIGFERQSETSKLVLQVEESWDLFILKELHRGGLNHPLKYNSFHNVTFGTEITTRPYCTRRDYSRTAVADRGDTDGTTPLNAFSPGKPAAQLVVEPVEEALVDSRAATSPQHGSRGRTPSPAAGSGGVIGVDRRGTALAIGARWNSHAGAHGFKRPLIQVRLRPGMSGRFHLTILRNALMIFSTGCPLTTGWTKSF